MSLTQFALMLDRLEAHSSSKDKVAIVRGFLAQDDGKIAKLLDYALSPLITFGVKQIPQPNLFLNHCNEDEAYHRTIKVLDSLSSREVTGGAATIGIQGLLNCLRPDHREAVRRVLIKDLRCGTTATVINKAVPGTVFEWCPQLAPSKYADPHKLNYSNGGVFCEIKHDGYRCSLVNDHGYKYKGKWDCEGLRSREGLRFENFEEIEFIFKNFGRRGRMFDMEVMSSQGFSVLKKRAGSDRGKNLHIPLHVVLFDCMPTSEWDANKSNTNFRQRREWLRDEFNDLMDHVHGHTVTVGGREIVISDMLHMSRGGWCRSAEEVLAFYDYARELGNEGIMVKDPNGAYEFTRSQVWLKLKPSQSADLKVIGFEKGNSNGKNANTLGALICEGEYNGRIVKTGVGSGFKPDKETRDHIWNNQSEYLGRTAEINFMEESEDEMGNPSLRHASFYRWRSDK